MGSVVMVVARLVFWAIAAVIVIALCRRGLTLGDEGYILSQARDIVDGKVPYRDLDMFVTPGMWYLLAGLFSVSGPSVIATRYLAAFCLLATMWTVRRNVRLCGGPLWGDFGAALVLVFAVWAWPAWSFSFYSPWSTLFGLTALSCTLQWMRSRRGAWLVACGIAVGLSLAFKQNYGFFAAVGCGLAIAIDAWGELADRPDRARETFRTTLRAAVLLTAGVLLVVAPLAAILAQQGALVAAFDSLVLRPFQGFVQAHSIRYLDLRNLWDSRQMWGTGGLIYMAVPVFTTAIRYVWPWPVVSLVGAMHVALYWLPPVAFAVLGAVGMSRLRVARTYAERALLATTLFAAMFFAGVFPRADYNHLINVYPPVLTLFAAAAAVHLGQGRWRSGPAMRAVAALSVGMFLCFALIGAIWANDLRKMYWIPLDSPRAGILVEPLEAEQFNHEIHTIRSMTAEGEPVFALPGLSMLPFLAERPMPTRYYNYYSVHVGHDKGRDAAEEIERSGARLILADYKNFFSDPQGMTTYASELVSYIQHNFRPVSSVSMQAHMLLVRREDPLPVVASRGLWWSCEIRGEGTPGRYVKEHLLFQSLYHSFRGAWGTRNQRLTVCQVQVPRQAHLRLGLELRQPALAREPVHVRADAWIFPDEGAPSRVLAHEWKLASDNAGDRPIGDEFDVDLSAWEGDVVTILLRSLVDGPIPSSTDLNGLSVMWDDARIESPDYAENSSGKPREERTVMDAAHGDPDEAAAKPEEDQPAADVFVPADVDESAPQPAESKSSRP